MDVKGIAVKATFDYVAHKYPNEIKQWLNSLPFQSKSIYSSPIYATSWYPLSESLIIPTQKIGSLFFQGNNEKAAWDLGRYSAEVALKGIYKIFVKISSPNFMLGRAARIFSSYFNPADIEILESQPKHVVLKLGSFEFNDRLIIYRIAGWLEQALEITQSTNIVVKPMQEFNDKMIAAKIIMDWN